MKGKFKCKNNLKDLRIYCGLTQNELANKCGTTQNTISSIENNIYNPSIGLALKISKELGFPVDYIFWIDSRHSTNMSS